MSFRVEKETDKNIHEIFGLYEHSIYSSIISLSRNNIKLDNINVLLKTAKEFEVTFIALCVLAVSQNMNKEYLDNQDMLNAQLDLIYQQAKKILSDLNAIAKNKNSDVSE